MIRNTLLTLALLAPAAAQELPHRVASGEVTTSSALLWTRPSSWGLVRFQVATDPDFQDIVRTRYAWTWNATRPVKRLVFALDPGTTYYYRANDWKGASDEGTFRTANLVDDRYGLRFGVSGDSRGDVMPFPSVTNAPDRDLDFFVLLGDTIYADVESPALPGVEQATTLAEFRVKHAEVNSAVDGLNGMGDLRAATAVLATIDDHEVTNDFAGGAHPSSDLRFDQNGEFINETGLFRRGIRAFVDYHPLLSTYYGFTADPRTRFKRKLYRSRAYGQDAALFVLDARSFRDEGLVPADITDPDDVVRFLLESFDPTRTMLGQVQVDELKADLLAAHEQGITWKFVFVPEPIQNLGPLAASDRFEGYAAERTELLGFIDAHDIANVVFVAADIHGTLVNDLTYQTGVGQPQLLSGAFEVTTGAIAYDAPFGPTVVELAFELGLISEGEKAVYDSLPLLLKDQFVKALIDVQIQPFGYGPLGLDGTQIDATLLAGDYVVVHTYGWTEFEIDATTQALTVTTYGVDPAEFAPPVVLQQFRVEAQ